jgi:hypothetical protein
MSHTRTRTATASEITAKALARAGTLPEAIALLIAVAITPTAPTSGTSQPGGGESGGESCGGCEVAFTPHVKSDHPPIAQGLSRPVTERISGMH